MINFENVGSKIKNIAKWLLIIGVVVGIVYFFVSLIMCISNWRYINFAGRADTLYIESEWITKGQYAQIGLNGIFYSIALGICSYISSYFMYGFALIVEAFEKKNIESD